MITAHDLRIDELKDRLRSVAPGTTLTPIATEALMRIDQFETDRLDLSQGRIGGSTVEQYRRLLEHRVDSLWKRKRMRVHGANETLANLEHASGRLRMAIVYTPKAMIDFILDENDSLIGCMYFDEVSSPATSPSAS